MFLRRSLARAYSCTFCSSVGTFGGLAPPPPQYHKAGYATVHSIPSLVPSDALIEIVIVESATFSRSNTSFDVISPVSGSIKNEVMLSTMLYVI